MEEKIRETIIKYCDKELSHIILSNNKKSEELKKVTVRPVILKEELMFQACEYRGTKVFHENFTADSLAQKLPVWLEGCFKQVEIKSGRADATILISSKGKATIREKKKENNGSQDFSHNRTKSYILKEGIPVPFLVELGVMTQEGKVVRAKYDKFRQINRFLEFIEDVLPELPKDRELQILDFGCGKSYLTFAMYYYLNELKGYPAQVTGLDLKEDVIAHCNELAVRFGYTKLNFLQGDIASYNGCTQIDMVVTLHACDTATDYALEKAVGWNAKVILSVPCCQHELNRTIANEVLAPVFRYGILKERIAALVTDGLRAELLEHIGYRVQVLEFIDMEHTPKNILLRAVRRNNIVPSGIKRERFEQYKNCIEQLHVSPALYRDLFLEKK